jgi:hypothetical protein
VLVAAYAILSLPLALVAVRAALAQAPPLHEEVARSLGCRPWTAIARVTLPRILPALGAAALDAGLRDQVREEVRAALREAGSTALLVTHDQEEALSLATRVAVTRTAESSSVPTRRRSTATRSTPGSPPSSARRSLFYGHGATVRVFLDGHGREILTRGAGHTLAAVGERVGIAVAGSALVYR